MTADEVHDADTARAKLPSLTGVDVLTTGADLPHKRPARLHRTVTEALAARMLHHNPWLTPPPLDAAATRGGLIPAFQHRVNLAWLTTYCLLAHCVSG